MRTGVRDNERRARASGDVEEARFGQVRAVDEDPELVALFDEACPSFCEAGPVRLPRIAELDAMTVVVRPAPDEPERADPARVPILEVVLERLGAFEVEDRPDLLARDAAFQFVDRSHDREVALGDREELAGDAGR